MGKRLALKQFRVSLDLTQAEFAEKMGVDRAHFQNIEIGVRNGTLPFWQKLQAAYNIPSADMWELMQPTEARDIDA